MESELKKLVLIDGNAIIHRAYHAIPKTFKTRSGEQTNVVYGFATTLIKVFEDLHPTYVAATFDLPGATFRHQQYEQYKATRVKADQELYDQIPRVKQLTETMGIPIYEKEGFEADDCIGTIVERLSNKSEIQMSKSETSSKSQIQDNNIVIPSTFAKLSVNSAEESPDRVSGRLNQAQDGESAKKLNPNAYNLDIYIVTGDKDLFQLINGNVKVYTLKKGLSQMQIIDSQNINEQYGLDPHDFIDLKSLAGDPSDNIPGVPGIGPKTATELLQKFDTLEKLYDEIDQRLKIKNPSHSELPSRLGPAETDAEESHHRVSGRAEDSSQNAQNDNLEHAASALGIKPRILQLLIDNKDQAFLSHQLATINHDVPLEFDLEQCRFGGYDRAKLRELFEELSFGSLLRRFGILPEKEDRKSTEEQKKKDEQLKLL